MFMSLEITRKNYNLEVVLPIFKLCLDNLNGKRTYLNFESKNAAQPIHSFIEYIIFSLKGFAFIFVF